MFSQLNVVIFKRLKNYDFFNFTFYVVYKLDACKF